MESGTNLIVEYHLYNSIGQLLLRDQFVETTTIDFSNIAAGVYYIWFHLNGERQRYSPTIRLLSVIFIIPFIQLVT